MKWLKKLFGMDKDEVKVPKVAKRKKNKRKKKSVAGRSLAAGKMKAGSGRPTLPPRCPGKITRPGRTHVRDDFEDVSDVIEEVSDISGYQANSGPTIHTYEDTSTGYTSSYDGGSSDYGGGGGCED